MLGFGALGEFALGEGPFGQANGVFAKFSAPAKKAVSVAVLATTFVGFVPPPQAKAAVFTQFSTPAKKKPIPAVWNFSVPAPRTQTAVFSQFSQPRARSVLPSEQPTGLFESAPLAPFPVFAQFSQPLKAKTVVQFGFQPFVYAAAPPDTHDGGVFVKKKRKKVGPDPIDLELEEKAKRRAAIELAVYGPEVTYEPQTSSIAAQPPRQPPNVEELARVIMQAQEAERQAQRLALEQDDEDVIEMILRDL